MGFNLDDYEPVAARLDRWLRAKLEGVDDSANGYPRVLTQMISEPGADICVMRAELWQGEQLIATGYAEEVRGSGNVNRTSHVENCETSAVGRALANCGVAGSDVSKRPSREEMSKVQRMEQGTDKRMPTVTVTQPSSKPFEGTKTIPNKFKAKCSLCGVMMEAGSGLATNSGSGWVNTHKEGACNPEVPF